MRRSAIAAILLMIVAGCGQSPEMIHPEEAEAIAKIRQLGGKVELNQQTGGRRAVKVYLHETNVGDNDLASLAQLPKLQNLFLGRTRTSDAGLEHLAALSELKTLSLNGTQVTDAGLQSLTGLKNLKMLNLQETRVTVAGAKRLRQTLPDLTIAR